MSDHTAIFSNYVISEDTTNDVLVVEKKDTGDTIEIDGKSFDGGSGVTFEFDTSAGTTSLVNGDGTDALVVNDGGPVEVPNSSIALDTDYVLWTASGSNDTENYSHVGTTLSNGVTEVEAKDGAGNTTTLT